MKRSGCNRRGAGRGFTLIEVLASMAVLALLVLALTRMFMEAASITKRGTTMLMRNSVGSTAMETLLQDFEGMVVNERLPCRFLADSTDDPGDSATTGGYGFGFDEAWFITTSGDQDDGRAYQTVHYYVTNSLATNALGAAYVRFNLIREVGIFANADNYGVDVMKKGLEWWKPSNWDDGYVHYSDRNLLAENVVRFDFYLQGWKNIKWMQDNPVLDKDEFISIDGPALDQTQSNMPPPAMDVYLQITSPDVAQESGMALAAVQSGDLNPADDVVIRAREMMIRDSSSLFGRASPIVVGAQKLHPTEHYMD